MRLTPKTVPEAWHEIGAAGQPAFANSWANFNPGLSPSAAFYKDAERVHLKGIVLGGTKYLRIFTLPVGYRPALALWLPVTISGDTDPVCSALTITPTGQVAPVVPVVAGEAWVSLNGVSFRV